MKRIVGLGTVAMDVLLQVDALPGPDGFAVITGRAYLPGGSGSNVISQAARLGAACSYTAKVGDDELGSQIIDSLRAEGVDVSGMRVEPGAVSLSTTVVVDARGERFILLDMGDAFAALRPDEIDIGQLAGAAVCYTDLLPAAAGLAFVRAAVDGGVPLVFGMEVGLATMQGFGLTTEDLLGVIAAAEVFLPCREGLAGLAGSDGLEQGLAFCAEHCPGTSIVTLGERGAVAVSGQRRIEVPGLKITPVDTTGAGDAFAGAFLHHRYFEGLDLAESLRAATAVAAAACTRVGARSGPDKQGLADFLASIKE